MLPSKPVLFVCATLSVVFAGVLIHIAFAGGPGCTSACDNNPHTLCDDTSTDCHGCTSAIFRKNCSGAKVTYWAPSVVGSVMGNSQACTCPVPCKTTYGGPCVFSGSPLPGYCTIYDCDYQQSYYACDSCSPAGTGTTTNVYTCIDVGCGNPCGAGCSTM
jgi:hypothetical protein